MPNKVCKTETLPSQYVAVSYNFVTNAWQSLQGQKKKKNWFLKNLLFLMSLKMCDKVQKTLTLSQYISFFCNLYKAFVRRSLEKGRYWAIN